MGTAHQEPSETVYVPSKLPDFFDSGSQTNYQYSEGVDIRLPLSARLRVTGFYSRLVVSDVEDIGWLTGTGESGGVEVFLHRDFTERLGGWISYTLSRTVETFPFPNGVARRVSSDHTHLLSVVAGYDLGKGWRVGGRLFFESGRPMRTVSVPTTQDTVPFTPPGNLPDFWRLDARLEKKWTLSNHRWITASIECFNLFDRAEPTGDYYVPGQGIVTYYESAIILPTIGVEAGF